MIRLGVLVIALSGLGFMPQARADALPRTLHPLSEQLSDAVVQADLAAIDGWRARLDGLPGAAKDRWRDFAARAWLTTARAEYLDDDQTGYPQAAFVRAVELIIQIEKGMEPITHKNVASATPPEGSARVPDSLSNALERMKRDSEFLCAAEELANIEMQLAWAGNEQLDQGDCERSRHVAEVARLMPIAKFKIEACHVEATPAEARPAPVPVAVMPKAERVEVPNVVIPTVEELKIPRNVHFGLNRFDLSPESHRVIDGIAALLVKYPSITVRLEGHTDSRGNDAYNLELSRRRVMAVREEFLGLGVDSTRIGWTFKGRSELFASEASTRGYALNRRVEMVFVDPENRDIKAERQEADIQIEADRPAPKPAVKRPVTPRSPARGVRSGTVNPRTPQKPPGSTSPR